MKILMALITLFFTQTTFATSMIGKIVEHNNEYFLLLNGEDKSYAYPFKEKDFKELSKLKNKTVKIDFDFDWKKKNESSFSMLIEYKTIKELKLSDLGLKQDEEVQVEEKTLTEMASSRTSRPGMEISDDVANTAILVGGAALAASILQSALQR